MSPVASWSPDHPGVEGILDHRWSSGETWSGWKSTGTGLNARLSAHDLSPLFLREENGAVTVSDSMIELLDATGSIPFDRVAISVFLYSGLLLDHWTPFQGVRVLLPGQEVNVGPAGVYLESTSDPPPRVFQGDLKRAAEALVDTLAGAIGEIEVPERFVHPLSGGRDSRHLLFELIRQGKPPRSCVTIGHNRRHPDVVTAKRVSRACRIRHELVTRGPTGFHAELARAVGAHLCADEHTWLVPLAMALRARTETVFDGLGGDVLFNGLFVQPDDLRLIERDDFPALARSLLGRFGPPSPKGLEAAGAILGIELLGRDAVEDLVAQRLENLSNEPNPISGFLYLYRTRRKISLVPRAIFQGIPHVHTPLAAPRLVALGRSLSLELFADGGRVHDRAIESIAPVRGLPFAGKLEARQRRFPGPLRLASTLQRRCWDRRYLEAAAREPVTALTRGFPHHRANWVMLLRVLSRHPRARRHGRRVAARLLG